MYRNEEKNNILFVFYTIKNPRHWTYEKIPEGWWWSGGGHTEPMTKNKKNQKQYKYKNEEQFD